MRELVLDLLSRSLRCRNASECALDLILHHIHIEVTYNDDSLHVRVVPLAVEVYKTLSLEGLELLFATDKSTS